MDNTFKKALLNDRLYDKKSLIYENGELTEIEDMLDDDRVHEGSLGHFANMRISTEMGIRFVLPLTRVSRSFEDPEYVVDIEEIYQIQSSNRFLSIEKMADVDRQALVERFDEEEELVALPEADDRNQWTGLIECDSENMMLGFVEVFRDKSNVEYVLKYAGTGNYTEIRLEKNNIMRSIYRRNLR